MNHSHHKTSWEDCFTLIDLRKTHPKCIVYGVSIGDEMQKLSPNSDVEVKLYSVEAALSVNRFEMATIMGAPF